MMTPLSKNLKETSAITAGALVAALYVVLTFLSMALGLSSGAVQLRLSEALTILPYFTPAAVPGLFVGCLLANALTGCAFWDVVFGSLATLIGAFGTYALRRYRFLAPWPPIVANTLVIPFILANVYGAEGTIPFFLVTVGIGELLSCGVLGYLLQHLLIRRKLF